MQPDSSPFQPLIIPVMFCSVLWQGSNLPPTPCPAPTLCRSFDDSRKVQELDVGTFVLGNRGVR